MATPKNTVKPRKARVSAGWMENEPFEGGKLTTKEEYSVDDFKAEGYQLANQVKLNSNGTPYLLAIDTVEDKKAALYMFKAFAANVKENQILSKSDISIYLVEDEDGNEGFVIGAPDFKGGISFF